MDKGNSLPSSRNADQKTKSIVAQDAFTTPASACLVHLREGANGLRMLQLITRNRSLRLVGRLVDRVHDW
jgi:hypothetical protein